MSRRPFDLRTLSDRSDRSDDFSIIPAGYVPGRTKYVIITGSVISGLGKGIFSAGLASLFEQQGYTTNLIKMDGYFNEDAGTLNPYRHGEVFVLDDGTECDMDIGTYERFVDRTFSQHNIFTNGKLNRRINELERSGQFSGSDVQFFPHVTGEIIHFIRDSSVIYDADITLVEIGGTVGDEENRPYISAMSDLAYQEGEQNVFFINLVWVIEASHLNEQKSKAAQHGTQMLMQMGVKPHMLVCRAENPLQPDVLRKLAERLRIPRNAVVDLHNMQTVYHVPEHLAGQNVHTMAIEHLGLTVRNLEGSSPFADYLRVFTRPQRSIRVGIAGKYMGPRDTYSSIHSALEHAGTAARVHVDVIDVPADTIESESATAEGRIDAARGYLDSLDGLIVPGGFGQRGWEGKIACIGLARTTGLPYLGICYGFQAAMVEFGRACCDLPGANTTEVDAETDAPVICLLPDQHEIEDVGASMRLGGQEVILLEGSRAAFLYEQTKVRERFRHRYEFNPLYRRVFEDSGMIFSGWAPGQPIMQVAELPTHTFFVGVQYHPEFISRPRRPAKLFVGFVEACVRQDKAAVGSSQTVRQRRST